MKGDNLGDRTGFNNLGVSITGGLKTVVRHLFLVDNADHLIGLSDPLGDV